MVEIWPELQDDIVMENGVEVLYLRIVKALYGCIESALLWYEVFKGKLEDMGFTVNPYSRCVAPKQINGHQCTITWYVDDAKVSHVDEKVVEKIISILQNIYGNLKAVNGKSHDLLGININFRDDRTIEIDIILFLKDIIAGFPDTISESEVNPVTKDIFEVNDSDIILDDKRAKVFHSICAKLLWAMRRSQLDIEVPILFLMTKVGCSTEGDWKKMKCLLEFINGTIDNKKRIAIENICTLIRMIDASHEVHDNM
eukprot:CAMPEP_0184874252 /NCGR_PEP_ID=MMETSP0580-20130426/42288_1 /TAXON_ID=1118495 /ORGANISM="Dactyliosolen fragilissimus" /LENGTH=255 /DNA_ID=CAMNT_0027377237 /DNA_START=17 /DNA_END=784 /DNA_ORIENTATION=+